MTETSNLTDALTRTIPQDTIPLPRNTARFLALSTGAPELLRADAKHQSGIRSSLQMATEDDDTPNWLQPGPYRPVSLEDVCLDGNYRHD